MRKGTLFVYTRLGFVYTLFVYTRSKPVNLIVIISNAIVSCSRLYIILQFLYFYFYFYHDILAVLQKVNMLL